MFRRLSKYHKYYYGYWRQWYLYRYYGEDNNPNQPEKSRFKKAILQTEAWLGKKIKDSYINNHAFDHILSNLIVGNSFYFLWIIDKLKEIEKSKPNEFKKLKKMLKNSQKSHEVVEIIAEIFFFEKLDIVDYEIDPIINNNLTPDLKIQFNDGNEVYIEITRMEDSKIIQKSNNTINKLERTLSELGFHFPPMYSYRFKREPTDIEIKELIEKLRLEGNVNSNVYIDNEYVKLHACKDYSYETIVDPECIKFRENVGLVNSPLEGWPFHEEPLERSIKKMIKKVRKYITIKKNLLISIHQLPWFFTTGNINEELLNHTNAVNLEHLKYTEIDFYNQYREKYASFNSVFAHDINDTYTLVNIFPGFHSRTLPELVSSIKTSYFKDV